MPRLAPGAPSRRSASDSVSSMPRGTGGRTGMSWVNSSSGWGTNRRRGGGGGTGGNRSRRGAGRGLRRGGVGRGRQLRGRRAGHPCWRLAGHRPCRRRCRRRCLLVRGRRQRRAGAGGAGGGGGGGRQRAADVVVPHRRVVEVAVAHTGLRVGGSGTAAPSGAGSVGGPSGGVPPRRRLRIHRIPRRRNSRPSSAAAPIVMSREIVP